MEEENVLDPKTTPQNNMRELLARIDKAASGQSKSGFSTGAVDQKIYNTDLGNSQYDKTIIPSINLDPRDYVKSMQEYRARMQPTSHQVANALVKFVPNVALGTVGTIASALDIEDYVNSDNEVGNWLTELTKQGQDAINEELPIYRQNPGKALDISDGGWWVSSISSLGESIGSFALGGGILGKGLTVAGNGLKALAGLSRVEKAKRLVNIIDKTNGGIIAKEGFNTVLNAAMLNQAEGILEGMDVQKEIYEKYVDELGHEGAKQRASEAATTVIATNRLNILLNLTSANLFFKGTKFSRRAHNLDTAKKNIGRGAVEGSQESAEELINLIAGSRGRAVGEQRDYTAKDVIDDITSMEALEAAILGFAGGMGQTVVTSEGINRLMKTGDPDNPGKKISIKEFNKKQFDKFQAHIDEIKSIDINESFRAAANSVKLNKEIVELDNRVRNLREQGKNVEAEKVEEEAQKLRNATVDVQAFDAFQKGTTEHLIKLYEGIANAPQKEGYSDNYKELATQQVQKIKELEKIYNKAMHYENGFAVYMNRAGVRDLKHSLEEVDNQIGVTQANLFKEVDRIAKANNYDTQGDNFFFHNIDVKAPEYDKVAAPIFDSDEYLEYVELVQKRNAINTEINQHNAAYKDLKGEKEQKKAKKRKEEFKEALSKKNEQQAEVLEKESEERIKDEAKENKIKEQKVKEQEVKEKKEAEKEVFENEYDKILNNYNIGEPVPMPSNVPDAYKDQEGTLKSIDKEKGIIILTLVDGKELEIRKEDNTSRITQEVMEGIYGSEGGSNFIYEHIDYSEPDPDEIGGAKIISRADDGTTLGSGWVERQYPEYLKWEREPRDKRGEKVNFSINNNREFLKPEWNKAIDLLEKNEGNLGALTEKQRKYLYAYLPILAKFGEGVYAPIETVPMNLSPEHQERAIENFKKHSLPLRTKIIDAMIAGVSIDQIQGSIQDQYKGILKVDTTEQGTPENENNILDLQYINGDVNKVSLYMVNSYGNLVNTAGDIRIRDLNGSGEVYMMIPRTNGEEFPLKLNVKRIQQNEAEALYRLYQLRMTQQDTAKATPLRELDDVDVEFFEENLKEVLDVLATTKSRRDITVKDITDFLIWDKSESPKSMVKLVGAKLHFGNKTVFGNEIGLQKNKDAFIKFLVENKRHHIKFKVRPEDTTNISVDTPAYKEYLLRSKILNTNAVVNEPTFQGRTHIYLNKDVEHPGKKAQPEAVIKTVQAAKDGKSPNAIREEIAQEVSEWTDKRAEALIAEGYEFEDALEMAVEESEAKYAELEKERLGLSSEVAPETVPEEAKDIDEVIEPSTYESVGFVKSVGQANHTALDPYNSFFEIYWKDGKHYLGVNPNLSDYARKQILNDPSSNVFGFFDPDSMPSDMSNNINITKLAEVKLEGGKFVQVISKGKVNFKGDDGKAINNFTEKTFEEIRKSEEDSVSLPEKKDAPIEDSQVKQTGKLKSSKSRRRGKNKSKGDNNNNDNKFCN